MKKLSVLILVVALALCLTGCGKSDAVKATEALISSIGQVSLDSEAAIVEAEEAYNALVEEEKADVETYEDLNSILKSSVEIVL